jgi:flagellar biosynthesis chaperone FliJ
MAFVFRLQTLLEQRIDLRKEAERELIERESELASERKILQGLEASAEAAAEHFRRRRAERSVPGAFRNMPILVQNELLLRLEMDVQDARSAVLSQQILVDQALELVEEARKVLATRRLDEDVLEKYRQKAEARFVQEQNYKEELEQDEIGNVMHLSRRK